MVIVLKVICFSLWMIIMLFLIKGSRHRTIVHHRELKVAVQDDDDIEMPLLKVGPPSILYCTPGQN
ncbi:MAG: hypothetical protein PHR65_10835 [Syntrophomonadaceae bacterium]|nr:hypothetical protein [Syntrophomonadaceae bacterium]MDD3890394.1 hypothetical protein [Syntrophomonadaceae bacterium]